MGQSPASACLQGQQMACALLEWNACYVHQIRFVCRHEDREPWTSWRDVKYNCESVWRVSNVGSRRGTLASSRRLHICHCSARHLPRHHCKNSLSASPCSAVYSIVFIWLSVCPVWARVCCRLSPPSCFLAEGCMRRLNQGSFVLLYFAFSELHLVCAFSITFNLSTLLYFPVWTNADDTV